MIKILIADDHPIFRKGLRNILNDEESMVVEDEAESGRQLLNLLSKKKYDTVILDIDMPDINGLDVLQQIKEQFPSLPVLILSFYPEEQYALRVLKLGGSGYVTKESAAEELVEALKQVVSGRKYITPSVAEGLSNNLDNGSGNLLHQRLSDREYQVFYKIAEGKNLNEISRDLHLSPKTVSTYKARILEKLELKNDAQIIRYAIKAGLVE